MKETRYLPIAVDTVNCITRILGKWDRTALPLDVDFCGSQTAMLAISILLGTLTVTPEIMKQVPELPTILMPVEAEIEWWQAFSRNNPGTFTDAQALTLAHLIAHADLCLSDDNYRYLHQGPVES